MHPFTLFVYCIICLFFVVFFVVLFVLFVLFVLMSLGLGGGENLESESDLCENLLEILFFSS